MNKFPETLQFMVDTVSIPGPYMILTAGRSAQDTSLGALSTATGGAMLRRHERRRSYRRKAKPDRSTKKLRYVLKGCSLAVSHPC